MKKSLLTASLALLLCGSASAFKVTVTPLGEKPASDNRQKVTVNRADVVVKEDFSAFTKGTNDSPDWENGGNALCNRYGSMLIDPSLTHGAPWTGHNVYQAGGAAGLYCINPLDPAYIQTPEMDYSGTIKVSFLCKALYTEYEEVDEITGEAVKHYFTSTTLMVGMGCRDGKRKFDIEGLDGYNFISNPIYHNQGWHEVEIEFDNYSAFNDAFLEVYAVGHLIVDDFKITQSIDKFIGAPVFTGYAGATEDSFTVTFEPVRKAFFYCTYLYELKGYDDDGNPVYKTVIPYSYFFSEKELEELERLGTTPEEELTRWAQDYGMELEEFLEEIMIFEAPDNYVGCIGHKEGQKSYSFTYEDLDPEKQYYFDIRSQYYRTFSPENIRPVEIVGTPTNLAATGITKDGFTANWSKITKAEGYTIDLYGVNIVEEYEESFVIFEEDFSGVNQYTDATDIANPDAVGEDSDMTIDDLTSTPGWVFPSELMLMVKDKVGLGVEGWRSFFLTSPTVYTAGADKATVSMSVESATRDFEMYIKFAGVIYKFAVEGSKYEGEFELPTNGMAETKFEIAGPDDAPIFIDYIIIMQPLKKGAKTFTWLGREEFGKETLSHTYSDLDPEWFGAYAFSANAWSGEGEKRLTSFDGERMIVDLKNGTSTPQWAAAGEIQAAEAVETARYTLDGRRIDAPVKGINIVRYSDGSVRKVMVK